MTTAGLPSIQKIAELLGGEVSGGQVLSPGPGHGPGDRSLSVKLDPDDRDGFMVHSFAGDDWKDCRDHVKKLLRLPEPPPPKPKQANGGGAPWTLLDTYIYPDADKKPYLRVRKKLDDKGKRRFVQSHWTGNGWANGKPEGPKIPYRWPELIAAPETAVIYFCEGERDADTLTRIGFVATTYSEGASAEWPPELTPCFKDRHVVILTDADAPGRKHGKKVAEAIFDVAASVRIVDLYPERFDGSDISDWIADDTAGVRLAKLVKEADEWEPTSAADDGIAKDERLILELKALSKLQYAKRRKEAADTIGIGVGELDKIVADMRGDGKGKDDPAPALYEHWNVEMAGEPVDGGILLRALKEAIRRYVFASDDQTLVVALWIVLSWLHAHCTHSPMLDVTSPERDSGKSTLLGVLNFLARRSLLCVEISRAALFRSITKWEPTLIVDEADDVLVDNADLRSVINSGWTRGQGTVRCHPDTHEPELFSTFAPKVVAMKGRNLPDTTLSRCIIITMRPRRADDPKEHAADFDHLDNETFARLRSQTMRWATDNGEMIAKATPEIPPGFYNRRRANWKPLLAIAEACGGEWKKEAWKAALAIEAVADTFDPSLGVELLRAIKAAFKANMDRITSADLVKDLVDDQTARWATYNKGKSISQRQVASLLKPYEIRPKTIKLGDGSTHRGYLLEMFADAFDRFCSPSGPNAPFRSATSATDLFSQEFSRFRSATGGDEVADRNDDKPFDNNEVAEVADENGGPGQKGTICAHCGLPGGNEVSIGGGPMVRLHRQCEDAYQGLQDDGQGLEGSPVASSPSRGAPRFRIIPGSVQPDAVCVFCLQDNGEEVLRIVGPEAGSKSETLHEGCAAAWFDGLRNFELPDDNDDPWEGRA